MRRVRITHRVAVRHDEPFVAKLLAQEPVLSLVIEAGRHAIHSVVTGSTDSADVKWNSVTGVERRGGEHTCT